MVKRVVIYVCGLFMVSLGIVLCKKCNLGISPISSIPFVLELITRIPFGTLTMLFHLVNITLQLFLVRSVWDMKILLQIPVAVLFGRVINMMQYIIEIDDTKFINQWLALVLSILFTGLGMACMLNMHLVQNPPDGLVSEVARIRKLEFGRVKVVYDMITLVISILLGGVFLHRISGIGAGTVVSALAVGKVSDLFKKKIGTYESGCIKGKQLKQL